MPPAPRPDPPPAARRLARLELDEALRALPESDVEGGQALRDGGGAQLVNKGEGLWVLRLDTPEGKAATAAVDVVTTAAVDVEAELVLRGRYIREYRCGCADFADRDTCAHLAALLALTQLTRVPKAEARPVRKPAAVTTRRLLDHVPDDALRDFVRTYATRHADFALELRVAFAHAVPVPQRFVRVVDRVLKRQGAQFNAREARRVDDALRSFASQLRDGLAARHYLDVAELVMALVPRLAVVAEKSERLQTDVPAYIRACLDDLRRVVEAPPPAALTERIDGWLDDQLERGAYYRHDLDLALHSLAEALGHDPAVVASRIERAIATHGPSPGRLLARLRALRRIGDEAAADALILAHLDATELLFSALQDEVASERYARAGRLAEAALRQNLPPADRLRVSRFAIANAALAGTPLLVARLAPELVLAEGSLASVSPVIEELPQPAAVAAREAILEHVRAHAATGPLAPAVTEALTIELLLQLGRHTEAEAALYRCDTAPTILRALPQLSGRLPGEDFLLLADTKIREELDRRLGRAAATWVTQVLEAIARRDRDEVAPRLVARLRRDFAQRHALMDALTAAHW